MASQRSADGRCPSPCAGDIRLRFQAYARTTIRRIECSAERNRHKTYRRPVRPDAAQRASSANAAADRQSYIDNIDTQIITLIGDIQFLSQQLDLTNIYNRQMQDLINSQNQEIQSINEQMVELDNTNRGILPKLEEMILTLESIVQNDIPFLHIASQIF